MFKSIDTAHTTHRLGAPLDYDRATHGPCEVLPVNESNYQWSSWWSVDWRSRLRILFGAPVRLTIVGGQPPVALTVERPVMP